MNTITVLISPDCTFTLHTAYTVTHVSTRHACNPHVARLMSEDMLQEHIVEFETWRVRYLNEEIRNWPPN